MLSGASDGHASSDEDPAGGQAKGENKELDRCRRERDPDTEYRGNQAKRPDRKAGTHEELRNTTDGASEGLCRLMAYLRSRCNIA